MKLRSGDREVRWRPGQVRPTEKYKPGDSTHPPGPQGPHLRRGYHLLPYETTEECTKQAARSFPRWVTVNVNVPSLLFTAPVLHKHCALCLTFSPVLTMTLQVFCPFHQLKNEAQTLLTVRVTKLWKVDSTYSGLITQGHFLAVSLLTNTCPMLLNWTNEVCRVHAWSCGMWVCGENTVIKKH